MSTDAPQIETPEMPALVIGSDVAEATDGAPAVERVAPTIRGKVDRFGVCWGTGRRKTAVARVRVKDGSGQITVNGRAMTEYFPLITDQHAVLAVLKATSMLEKVEVIIQVEGGGSTGQSGACKLGIARALQAKNPELHPILTEGSYLTRDDRKVERKKYGHKKARRSFQFSKR